MQSHHSILAGILLIILPLIGCNTQRPTKEIKYEERVATAADSFHKVNVRSVVDSLNARIRADSFSYYKFLHPVLTPNDTLEYWVVDDEPVRINIIMRPGANTIWPTLYILNDTLIQARHREQISNDTTSVATETIMYLSSGKIAFAEERQVELQDYQLPSLIRMQPFSVSQRSFGELELLYKNYYPSLKIAADKNYAQFKK